MIVTLHKNADADSVRRALVARGLWVEALSRASGEVAHYLVGSASVPVNPTELADIPGVVEVLRSPSSHPRMDAQGPAVTVRGIAIGGAVPVVMAGPCAVESAAQIDAIAARVSALGVQFLRGGAFKPRTSPYAFQGHGRDALSWLREAADRHGMAIVTEALSENDVSAVAEGADMVQIGSRNMQNFALLKAAGRAGRPVLLKRAMSATVEEWLLAGEYLLSHGAPGVVLCERGIRHFDDSTRNLLDLGAVALLAHSHRLPVVVDPSHATGRRDLVAPLCRAALAAGAAGVMLETHDDPGRALSDGAQALLPEQFRAAVTGIGLTPRSAS